MRLWRSPSYSSGESRAPPRATSAAALARSRLSLSTLLPSPVPSAPVYVPIVNPLVHPAVVGWRDNSVRPIDWTAFSLAHPP